MSYGPSDIDELVSALKGKKVVLCPTDTIWGLSCLANEDDLVKRIIEVKNRPINKRFIVLFPSLTMAERYFNEFPKDLVETHLGTERPTTIILEGAKNLSPFVLGENESLAFRIPQFGFCKDYMQVLNTPIVSTSANLSGNESPSNFLEINSLIKKEVDYIAKPFRNQTSSGKPSKIIKVNIDGIQVLRS